MVCWTSAEHLADIAEESSAGIGDMGPGRLLEAPDTDSMDSSGVSWGEQIGSRGGVKTVQLSASEKTDRISASAEQGENTGEVGAAGVSGMGAGEEGVEQTAGATDSTLMSSESLKMWV